MLVFSANLVLFWWSKKQHGDDEIAKTVRHTTNQQPSISLLCYSIALSCEFLHPNKGRFSWICADVSDSSCLSIKTILQLWLAACCATGCSWTPAPLGVSMHNVIAPAAPSRCFFFFFCSHTNTVGGRGREQSLSNQTKDEFTGLNSKTPDAHFYNCLIQWFISKDCDTVDRNSADVCEPEYILVWMDGWWRHVFLPAWFHPNFFLTRVVISQTLLKHLRGR